MDHRKRIVLFASAALAPIAMAVPHAASAQDTAPSIALEEVVVTAQKTTANLQDVAAVVSVVAPTEMARVGVTDVRGVQFMVPSVRFNRQQSVAQMFIRGVGIASDALSLDQAVALTLNGVVQPREAGGASLFDIDHIEVLKGPQGTIYGNDAAGGVIHVVTARPTNDFSGRGSLEVGNYGRVHLSLAQNAPLGDKTQVRFALDRLKRDGYISNGLDDQDATAGRLTLTSQLTDDIDILVWGSGYHAGGKGDAGIAVPFINPSDPWNMPWDPVNVISFAPGQRTQHRSVNISEVGAELNWDLGDVSLTYIPGYVYTRQRGHLVIDTGPVRILQEVRNNRKQQTHEVRLAGDNPDARLQWLVGGYYYKLDSSEWRSTVANINYDIPDQPNKSMAAYAQGTYSVTDALRATVGLRYSKIEKSATGRRFTPAPASLPIPFQAAFDWTHTDWKFGLEYDISENSMVYGTIQTGYLGGGINFFNAGAGLSPLVEPEELLAYSIGIKNTLLDGRMRLNGEAFYYDYENYQVGLLNVAAGTNVVSNVPKSEIYGIEGEMQFRITANDTVSLNAGYLHAEFTDFRIPLGVASAVRGFDYSGYQMPFAPELTVNLGYEHTWNLSNGSRLVAGLQTQYSSSYWMSFSHGVTRCNNVSPAVRSQAACVDPSLQQPEFTNTSVDLTWHAPNDKFSLAVWVRNIEDEAVRFSGGDGGLSPAGAVTSLAATTLAPPRTYGVRLGLTW